MYVQDTEKSQLLNCSKNGKIDVCIEQYGQNSETQGWPGRKNQWKGVGAKSSLWEDKKQFSLSAGLKHIHFQYLESSQLSLTPGLSFYLLEHGLRPQWPVAQASVPGVLCGLPWETEHNIGTEFSWLLSLGMGTIWGKPSWMLSSFLLCIMDQMTPNVRKGPQMPIFQNSFEDFRSRDRSHQLQYLQSAIPGWVFFPPTQR